MQTIVMYHFGEHEEDGGLVIDGVANVPDTATTLEIRTVLAKEFPHVKRWEVVEVFSFDRITETVSNLILMNVED